MSLNKFTDGTIKEWMKIGCSEMNCNNMQCGTMSVNDVVEMRIGKDIDFVNQNSTPTNPALGETKIYTKNDSKLYALDSLGNEIAVGDDSGDITDLNTKTQNIELLTTPGETVHTGNFSTDNVTANNIELTGTSTITNLHTDDEEIHLTGTIPTNQGGRAVAVGYLAGNTNQESNCVAIGINAGGTDQKFQAIAIGSNSGLNNQGSYSIALGTNVGNSNQHTQSLLINSTPAALDSTEVGQIILNTTECRVQVDSEKIEIGRNSTSQPNSVVIGGNINLGASNSSQTMVGFDICSSGASGKNIVCLGSGAGLRGCADNSVCIGSGAPDHHR
jgi:hypothetical protein